MNHIPRGRCRITSARILLGAALAFSAATAGPLQAQDEGPQPGRPNGRAQDEPRDPVTNRRIHDGEPIYLSFNNVAIKDTLDFIIETTGKTVVPNLQALSPKVTIISDVPMSRNEALDKLFVSFLDHNVGVVEHDDIIRIAMLDQINTIDLPVIGPEESLLGRTDDGVIVNKVFNIRYRDAEAIGDVLIELIPTWGRVEVEGGSNSIVAVINVGTGKKLEEIINSLDQQGNYETRTFVLHHTDAATIAGYILTLYSESEGGGGGGSPQRDPRFDPRDPRNQGRDDRGGGGAGSAAGGGTELRVVPNTRSNTVTVQADPLILEQIESQIKVWDQEHADAELMRVYHLKYMDAVVAANILNELLAGGASLTGGQLQRGGQGGAPMAAGGSGSTGGAVRLQDLFQVKADGGANRLIVFALTPASFEWFDDIMDQLDQPGARSSPLVIELKHADAQELAQELNIAFAPTGQGGEFRGQTEGLTEFEGAAAFGGGTETGGQASTFETEGTEAQPMDFWWLDSRDVDQAAEQSELVERVRVMPIFRRNALLIIGPPYYQEMMAEMVRTLDQPGRQVLITALIVEVELDDSTSLGLRWGTGGLGGTGDNQLRASGSLTASEDDILSDLFDTSVLDVEADLNVVLNALATDSNLRVLSEPRIFTADNEQANFFDGQTIQVVADTLTDIQTGNLNSSFEDKDVGITLMARPRITVNRDVDLLVELRLSSLAPAPTTQGGLIFDQRITSTRAVLKDGQTIVISGILREQESDVIRKIPLLGDIPLIGALFTSIDVSRQRSEILAFITPIVVDNTEENEALNEPMRRRGDELQRPLDDQVRDPAGAERVWDVLPDADHLREEIEDPADADDDSETLEEAVEETAGEDGTTDTADEDAGSGGGES